MKKILIAASVTMVLAAPALANSCPILMNEIDLAMASETHADPQVLKQIQDLRAEGEALHKAGKHAQAVEKLEHALELIDGRESKDH